MFDANRTARALLVSRCADFASVLSGVDADVVAPAKVYTYASEAAPKAQTIYPCLEVFPPTGLLEVTSDAITSVLEFTVLATTNSANPEEADKACQAYLTTLVRLFAMYESGSCRYEVTEFDTSPQLPVEARVLQSVGVRVRVTTIEDL